MSRDKGPTKKNKQMDKSVAIIKRISSYQTSDRNVTNPTSTTRRWSSTRPRRPPLFYSHTRISLFVSFICTKEVERTCLIHTFLCGRLLCSAVMRSSGAFHGFNATRLSVYLFVSFFLRECGTLWPFILVLKALYSEPGRMLSLR